MKLGFVSAILPEQSFEQVLQTAAEIGYDCVEMMCWPVSRADRRYAGVTHVDVTRLNPADAQRLLESCSQYGITISGLGYYPNPLSPIAAEASLAVDHLQKVIEAAALLGVRLVNTFVGRDWTKTIDDNWPRFLDTWRPIVEFAQRCEVRIGIENCPMLFTGDEWPGGKNLAISPAIWRRMFADVGHPNFGLNYDPSHLIWQQMDYLWPLAEFADRIFHVHLKDVQIDRRRLNDVGILATPLEYHAPKLPGLGAIDWGQFISALRKVGYPGPVCVEVEDRAYEADLPARLRALRQTHDFLRHFIPRQQPIP